MINLYLMILQPDKAGAKGEWIETKYSDIVSFESDICSHSKNAYCEVYMRFLITGATGDVGSRAVHELLALGLHPRVFVRDTAKATARFGNDIDMAVGDLTDPASLRAALRGIDKLFLVTVGPQIPVLDQAAATAARDLGIQHLVKLSSLDVKQSLAIGAWHERGEAAIRAAGVPFTFLQPTGFMSNLLAWSHSVRSESVVRSSTGAGRRPFIHSDDIAEVAVKVLMTQMNESNNTTSAKQNGRSGQVAQSDRTNFLGQSLALTGPEALNFAEVTQKISAAVGKPLRYEAITDEEARRRYAATGASAEETEAHVALWQAIREDRLATLTDTVERILGRKPKTLDDWLAENAAAFQ